MIEAHEEGVVEQFVAYANVERLLIRDLRPAVLGYPVVTTFDDISAYTNGFLNYLSYAYMKFECLQSLSV